MPDEIQIVDSAPAAAPAVTQTEQPVPVTPAAPARAPTIDEQYEQEFGGGVTAPIEAEGEEEAAPVEEPPAEDAAPPAQESDEVAALKKEAADAKAEAERLRAEIAASKPKPLEAPEAPEPELTLPERPRPEDYQFGSADEDFIEALGEWSATVTHMKLQQKDAEARAQAEIKAEIAEVDAGWKNAIAQPDIAEKYPDFQAVVVDGASADKWPCSPVMTVAIKSSPVGPDVAYHLASNAAEAGRIAQLSPMEQVLEIGRLEGRYLYERETKEAAPPIAVEDKPVKVASKAPSPPAARSRGAGGQFTSGADAVYDRLLREMA